MILLLLMPDLYIVGSQNIHIGVVQAKAHFHTLQTLPDQSEGTRRPYLCLCHLQLAPFSDCHPVFQPVALEDMLFHMGCFEQLPRNEMKGSKDDPVPTARQNPKKIPPKSSCVSHTSVTICTSVSSFLFPQREAADLGLSKPYKAAQRLPA